MHRRHRLSALFATLVTAVASFGWLSPAAQASAAPGGRELNIVAHEDDDVIFLNPDIQNSITAGRMVRTVYVTAGNLAHDGADFDYWQSRERGALAAYATMGGKVTQQLTGTESYAYFSTLYDFSSHTVPGACGAQPCTIDVWTLKGTPTPGQVSVTFLRISGANTGTSMWPLEKLWQGSLTSLMTVGPIGISYADSTARQSCTPGSATNSAGCRTYTLDQLTSLMGGIMQDFAPDRIRLQDPSGTDYTTALRDHTDHMHGARVALEAYWNYLKRAPADTPGLLLYRAYYTGPADGFPGLPPNVSGAPLSAKDAALNNDCVFDNQTTGPGCYQTPDGWAQRRYALAPLPLLPGPVANGVLLDDGQLGCLGAAGGSVGLADCRLSQSWVLDRVGHLQFIPNGQCLTIPPSSQVAGVSGPVQLGPCATATSWLFLTDGALLGSHSKVLKAASDGTLQVTDLFSYNADLQQGGVGNLSVIDLTDLGSRWAQ